MAKKKTNPSSTLAGTPPFSEPGFECRSPCGRVWFVPISGVAKDYADFLMNADGLSAEAAKQQVCENAEFLPTWFGDQFDWDDVVRCGRLVKDASATDIANALDFVRKFAGTGPQNDCKDHGIKVAAAA